MMGPKALAMNAECRAPAEGMEGWPLWTQTRLHGIKKGIKTYSYLVSVQGNKFMISLTVFKILTNSFNRSL